MRRHKMTPAVAGRLWLALIVSPLPLHAQWQPGADTPFIDQVVATRSDDIYFARTRHHGVLRSLDGGRNWQGRNQGLPPRQVYPFNRDDTFQTVTALAVADANPELLIAATAGALYISDDGGAVWRQVPVASPVGRNSYFTAVARTTDDPQQLLVGTSFDGLYWSGDMGATWRDLSGRIRFLARGAGFVEELSAVAFHPASDRDAGVGPGGIAIAVGFGGDVYEAVDGWTWHSRGRPNGRVGQIAYRPLPSGGADPTWQLVAVSESGRSVTNAAGRWERLGTLPATAESRTPPPSAAARLAHAADRSGIYVSAASAASADGRLPQLIALAKDHDMAAIVVDLKDDFGRVTYDTDLPTPAAIGAAKPQIDLELLLAQAHAAGLYVVARLVVFKDELLYKWQDNRLAIWDSERDEPWRQLHRVANDGDEPRFEQREFWVDPFAPEVWRYNVHIAAELAERGVDEVQFDYIRFPSDGPTQRATYRHRRPGMTKVEAIESLLIMARERVHVPVSTALFGFNSWHRMGNWIGQSIETLSEYVDVISPMFYPSHFPSSFLAEHSYLDRAFTIYRTGVDRAQELVAGRSLIRPYVQAFLIGGELAMERPEYGRYLIEQLSGTKEAGGSGFTLWNASNRYYMVTEPLNRFALPLTTESALD